MIKVIFSNNNLTQFQSDLARILNLMNPLSVKIGTHIDTYAAKVTLEYQGHYDETSMKILREGACLGDGFCGSCEVYAYDLDENGNPDNCYMFKKPKSYEYNAYTNRINVEIEFDEVYDGPSIDKECNEIEKMKYFVTMLRKLMKEEFDKNSKEKKEMNDIEMNATILEGSSDDINSRCEKLMMIDDVYDIIMTIEDNVSKKYLLIYYHEILSVLRIMGWQWHLDSAKIVEKSYMEYGLQFNDGDIVLKYFTVIDNIDLMIHFTQTGCMTVSYIYNGTRIMEFCRDYMTGCHFTILPTDNKFDKFISTFMFISGSIICEDFGSYNEYIPDGKWKYSDK